MTKRTRQRNQAGIKRGNLKTTVHAPTKEAQGFAYVPKKGARHVLDDDLLERPKEWDEIRQKFIEIGPIPRGKAGIEDVRLSKHIKAVLRRIEWHIAHPNADPDEEPLGLVGGEIDLEAACIKALLTEKQRQVVMLVISEQLTVRKAAAVLGIDMSSVRDRLRWARLKLRAYFGGLDPLTEEVD